MGVYKKNGNWFIDFYCGSKRIRRMIGPSKRLAETALKDAQIKVAKGEYLGIYEDKKITLKDFKEEYLKYMQGDWMLIISSGVRELSTTISYPTSQNIFQESPPKMLKDI